jgi:hypothetical protein
MTFTDGHFEYWKWQAINTIKVRRQARDPSMAHLQRKFIPESKAGYQDLWKMQRGVWAMSQLSRIRVSTEDFVLSAPVALLKPCFKKACVK